MSCPSLVPENLLTGFTAGVPDPNWPAHGDVAHLNARCPSRHLTEGRPTTVNPAEAVAAAAAVGKATADGASGDLELGAIVAPEVNSWADAGRDLFSPAAEPARVIAIQHSGVPLSLEPGSADDPIQRHGDLWDLLAPATCGDPVVAGVTTAIVPEPVTEAADAAVQGYNERTPYAQAGAFFDLGTATERDDAGMLTVLAQLLEEALDTGSDLTGEDLLTAARGITTLPATR